MQKIVEEAVELILPVDIKNIAESRHASKSAAANL
jgi:hypothetical protein